MEYSLANLNQNSNLNTLKLIDIINQLNLIGFEVDEVFNEKCIENAFIDNIRILIKIPANREDLLNERFLLVELSTILNFKLNHLWKEIIQNYHFVLKEKYFKYYSFEKFELKTKDISDILIYNIEITNFQKLTSPLWIQKKLIDFGAQPAKNIEDFLTLTNLEWGQNFNYYSNKNKPFLIEKLNQPETFIDFNNISLLLLPGTIVLRDDQKNILTVLGLINITTKLNSNSGIFLEATFYNNNFPKNESIPPILDSKNNLRSLRKVCLENFKYSFQRLLTLLELNSSPSLVPKIYSNFGKSIQLKGKKILKCRQIALKKVLNLAAFNFSIFEKSGLKIICQTKNAFYFSIPNYRNDLEREIDLIEEYSRFIGYKNFPEIFPKKLTTNLSNKLNQYELIKQFFLNSGFNEVLTNPIIDNKKYQLNSISLTNPLNNEFFNLRTNLFFKLLDAFEKNLNSGFEQKNIFEIGRTFKRKKNSIVETEKLGGIFQLEKIKKSKFSTLEWFFAKGFIENFLCLFGYENIETEQNYFALNIFHQTKSLVFKNNNEIIGIFGEINPGLESSATAKYPIYLFEFNLAFFKNWRFARNIKTYKEYSKYPATIKDLSFTIKKEANFAVLKKTIEKNSTLVNRIEFFDVYFEEKISQNVNIGIRLEFQSFLRTLTTEEIEAEIHFLKEQLVKEFEITFR